MKKFAPDWKKPAINDPSAKAKSKPKTKPKPATKPRSPTGKGSGSGSKTTAKSRLTTSTASSSTRRPGASGGLKSGASAIEEAKRKRQAMTKAWKAQQDHQKELDQRSPPKAALARAKAKSGGLSTRTGGRSGAGAKSKLKSGTTTGGTTSSRAAAAKARREAAHAASLKSAEAAKARKAEKQAQAKQVWMQLSFFVLFDTTRVHDVVGVADDLLNFLSMSSEYKFKAK